MLNVLTTEKSSLTRYVNHFDFKKHLSIAHKSCPKKKRLAYQIIKRTGSYNKWLIKRSHWQVQQNIRHCKTLVGIQRKVLRHLQIMFNNTSQIISYFNPNFRNGYQCTLRVVRRCLSFVLETNKEFDVINEEIRFETICRSQYRKRKANYMNIISVFQEYLLS